MPRRQPWDSLNAGDVAQVHGDVVTILDPTTRTTQFAVLQNAGAQFRVRDFSLGFDGMNLGPAGTSVDNVKLQAGRIGLTAEVTGLTVDPNGHAAFSIRRRSSISPKVRMRAVGSSCRSTGRTPAMS